MIGAKKLLKLARKWQKLAAIRRKRITIPEGIGSVETNSGSTSAKGHFVVYSADQKRFSLPLAYLNNEIIQELLNIAAEAFGLPSKGPLTVPCDAEFMEYVIALIKQQVTGDVQRALLMSVASCCSLSFYLQHQETSNQIPICSF
ncbi:auxin-responsive protein SAUR67-like [Ricinus communis]|uniref:auxin-responsive protein SAUR67-like n=1 Tax=Ricinus communis TaxID=3988 RepID=UPI00201AFB4B|nr:auxin-responsive protein SAUR67-like [Ricinus communis]